MPACRKNSLSSCILLAAFAAGLAEARSVYLNGVDISGATNQGLKGVDLQINDKGDVFITAPNYEVHEEDSYLPLSSMMGAAPGAPSEAPVHKAPKMVPGDQVKSINLDQLPTMPAGLPEDKSEAKPSEGASASDAKPLPGSVASNPPPGEQPPPPAAKAGSKMPNQ